MPKAGLTPPTAELLFKHIGHVGSNKVRSFWLGLTHGLTSSTPTGDATKRYYQHLKPTALVRRTASVSGVIKKTAKVSRRKKKTLSLTTCWQK